MNIRFLTVDLLVIILISILLSNVACDFFSPCPKKETYRMTSPDKKVDAVIVEENCGATMPFVDLIYIVPCGDSIKNHSPIYKSTYTRELEVKWAESKRLIISYKNFVGGRRPRLPRFRSRDINVAAGLASHLWGV